MALNVGRLMSELERMTVTELRRRYVEVFGEETRSYHKAYLVRRIAWRVQANAEGDLPERARRRALELANDADLRLRGPTQRPTPPPSLDGFEVHEVKLNLDPQRDPRYDAVSVRGIGTFEKSSSVPMPWLTPNTSELAEKSLLDISVSAVSGTIVGDSQNLRHFVGIAMEMVHFDSSTTILLTPVSIEADSTDAQMHAELVAFVLGGDDPNARPWQVPGTPPPGQQPPPPGYVWCFCSNCYLDCLEDAECDETYDYCVTQICDPIYATCRDGADQVYDWCIGSCDCEGTPGIWCSARCWTCNTNWGLQQSFCWSARVGCLSGCELAKTSCYSGCYFGSWSLYQNPPGCP